MQINASRVMEDCLHMVIRHCQDLVLWNRRKSQSSKSAARYGVLALEVDNRLGRLYAGGFRAVSTEKESTP
jgi:hypothetical protein